MFEYDVIATGSTGNAVLITVTPEGQHPYKILIDMGIPYKRLKQAVNEASFVFISHRHGDHINKSSYNKLSLEHPRTTVITNQDVYELTLEKGLVSPDVIINDFQTFYLGDLKITALPNEHGVQCHGWIFELGNEVLLYATDLSTTIHYQAYLRKNNLKVNHLLLEGNYDVNVFKFYVSLKGTSVKDLFDRGSARHLPIQHYEAFREEFLAPEGKSIMLHTSSTYATPEGLITKLNSERERLNEKQGTHYKEIFIQDYYNWLEGGK